MKKLLMIGAIAFALSAPNVFAQNPTDFDIDTLMLPGKKMVVTATLNQPEFIGTRYVSAYPVTYWCMGQVSPNMYLGSFMPNEEDTIPSVGIFQTDTIDFSLYDNCTNPNAFVFKYVVIGVPQGDTSGAQGIFWIEKILEIYINPTLGIDDVDITKINMYPNPGDNFVTIDGLRDVQQISVYDMSGRVVQTVQVQSEKVILDVTGMKNGVYMVRFDDSAGKKLLIQH